MDWRYSYTFNSRRSVVMSQEAMVATSHPLAVQVGIDIQEGTFYTFSVDGSAKSLSGNYLNETEAGGGITYSFSVYSGISACGCESYQICSCQFDGGYGCPSYGGICWCEVQCGCQLYRI